MRQSAKSGLVLSLSAIAVALLVWTIAGDRASQPYTVPRTGLSAWTVVTSHGDEPWLLGLQPAPALAEALVEQLSEKTGMALVAPAQTVLPLVLRAEYDDALQGVYGVDSLLRVARDVAIESATFEPICIAHRAESAGAAERQLYYIAFNSAGFREFRADLMPPQPEHGGTGVYDPAALVPLMPVAATDSDFGRWWPLAFDRRTDCQAQLLAQ
jgi:hypothetical protein